MPNLMQTDASIDESHPMRTTLTIDDQLFAQAQALAQPGMEKSELIRECVKAFIQRQTARRLADLGGLAPDIEAVPRRREETSNAETNAATPPTAP
jgi:metal-responsive CopG/Arc/MetJ family transcriptional regulator